MLILAVTFYQVAISPWLGRNCRFEPSCSQYFIDSVKLYGPIRGTVKGVLRVCRCHPFGGSGFDPP
jgi:putative membrane protein insertion efficiency factor